MYLDVPSLLESVIMLPYVSLCISVVFMCVCVCVCVCVCMQLMCSRIYTVPFAQRIHMQRVCKQYEGMLTHSILAEHAVSKKRLEVSLSDNS